MQNASVFRNTAARTLTVAHPRAQPKQAQAEGGTTASRSFTQAHPRGLTTGRKETTRTQPQYPPTVDRH